jgi:hypothetical protein
MKPLIVAALILTGLISAPMATADPTCNNPYTCGVQPNPAWNGQLQNTWDLPGIYGGWTNDPIYCNPMSRQCGIYAPNPNR